MQGKFVSPSRLSPLPFLVGFGLQLAVLHAVACIGSTPASLAPTDAGSASGDATPSEGDAPLETCVGDGQPSVCGAPNTDSVLLRWTASVTPGVTYDAYRSPGCTGMYTRQASGITSTTWTDNAVTGGQTYCYVTTAVNGSGESVDSNSAQAMVP
jgi:hypothetical protein